MRRLQHGMSWLELAVAASLLGILAIVMLQRLESYQELAERADMEYGVSVFKSALRMRVGVLMVEERMRDKQRLVCENPVRWLERRPPNYAGEAHGVAIKDVPPGNWYYDPVECTMAYMVRNGRHFVPDSAGLKRVRFRVGLDALGTVEHPGGVALVPVEPYRWMEQ